MKGDVWDTVGVDLIDPLPETPRGNKYIITVSCYFSKWLEATDLPDKGTDGVTASASHNMAAAESRSLTKGENS